MDRQKIASELLRLATALVADDRFRLLGSDLSHELNNALKKFDSYIFGGVDLEKGVAYAKVPNAKHPTHAHLAEVSPREFTKMIKRVLSQDIPGVKVGFKGSGSANDIFSTYTYTFTPSGDKLRGIVEAERELTWNEYFERVKKAMGPNVRFVEALTKKYAAALNRAYAGAEVRSAGVDVFHAEKLGSGYNAYMHAELKGPYGDGMGFRAMYHLDRRFKSDKTPVFVEGPHTSKWKRWPTPATLIKTINSFSDYQKKYELEKVGVHEGIDMREVADFLKRQRTWFHLDDMDARSVSMSTREHGDVGSETTGSEDWNEGARLRKLIRKQFGDAVTVDLEPVDEWTHLTVWKA